MGTCRRCYSDKTIPKKFSAQNNMDPGDVPEELQGLTEIEEMLIAQIFPVISVYCLRGGQYAYKGNVINFPQDVHKFVTRLPRHPSSLDTLVVRQRSANGSTFRDFNVCRIKIARALSWLKENNRYYINIIIDNEILQSLPENGPIDEYLPQVQNADEQLNDNELNDDENEQLNDNINETNDTIIRNFVPFFPPSHSYSWIYHPRLSDTVSIWKC
jgi:hypothetical protein